MTIRRAPPASASNASLRRCGRRSQLQASLAAARCGNGSGTSGSACTQCLGSQGPTSRWACGDSDSTRVPCRPGTGAQSSKARWALGDADGTHFASCTGCTLLGLSSHPERLFYGARPGKHPGDPGSHGQASACTVCTPASVGWGLGLRPALLGCHPLVFTAPSPAISFPFLPDQNHSLLQGCRCSLAVPPGDGVPGRLGGACGGRHADVLPRPREHQGKGGTAGVRVCDCGPAEPPEQAFCCARSARSPQLCCTSPPCCCRRKSMLSPGT